MSAADILEQLRAANPAPEADRIDVDDTALLDAIDRRYASLSARTERAVTRRLEVLDRAKGGQIVDPEIDASGATDEPPGIVRHRSLIVIAAAAAAVIVAVVAFSSLRDESARVTTVDQPSTPTGDVYLAPGQTLLRADPIVVLGAPAPEPRFDTTPLGPEVELEPLNNDDIDSLVEWAESSPGPVTGNGTLVRIIAGGVVGDSDPAFVAYYDDPDPTMGPMRWLCEFSFSRDITGEILGSGSACGGSKPDEYLELPGGIPRYDIPRLNYNIDSHGYVHFYPVSEETSVIAFATADQTLWQRPLGGFAIFPADLDEREPFEITTFDPDGNILEHETLNEPPLDPSEYPITRPEIDSSAQYPQTGPSDSDGTP